MNLMYFGVWGHTGHYLWNPDGSWPENCRQLSKEIDCNFAPDNLGCQIEGKATLTHDATGQTIVAFWDRSGDPRGNSNSAFVAEGKHTFEAVMEEARKQFPHVFDRILFTIEYCSSGSNLT